MKTYLLKFKNKKQNYVVVRDETDSEIRGFLFSENNEFLGFSIIKKDTLSNFVICEVNEQIKPHLSKFIETDISIIENYFKQLFPLSDVNKTNFRNNKNKSKK